MIKPIGKALAYVTWLIIATLGFAYVWQCYTDISIPLPEPFVLWLVDEVYKAQNPDQIQNLDLICVLLVSFAFVATLTGFIVFLWKQRKKSALFSNNSAT